MIKMIFLDVGGVIILNRTEQVDDLKLKMKNLNDQKNKDKFVFGIITNNFLVEYN